MIRPTHFPKILMTTLFLLSFGKSYAVEFHECEKFVGKDESKHSACLQYSFIEAVAKKQYGKISQWLETDPSKAKKYEYNYHLTRLMCGGKTGETAFNVEDKDELIKVTGQLLDFGASFDYMPHFQIVTPLFCLSNRNSSELLDYALTRIKPSKKDLDASLYEGSAPQYVPLYRAVLNDDLGSAKVLVKHGATPDFSVWDGETALKAALEKHNVKIANWLLDEGASVHKRDEDKGCSGKSALDYALEIPTTIKGRESIIQRIKELMLLPSSFNENCSTSKVLSLSPKAN